METKKILVVFYSHSGTTRKAAEQIKAAAGGDIFELLPEDPYPADYNTVVKQAKKEIAEGFMPKLQKLPDVSGYDIILAGSPNWWSTIAPPLAAFLGSRDFSGKLIAPFITHGGGGLGKSVTAIGKLCPGANLAAGFDANQPGKIAGWLKSLGL